MGQSKTLTEKQRLFTLEYIIDYNGTQAAIRAGYSPKYAAQQAQKLLADERINEAIEEATAECIKRLHITKDAVVLKWWQMANADYNELTQLRRFNCRYCHGEDHEYQWTPKEYEAACKQAVDIDKPEPDCAGGTDYDVTRAPNADCPECRGLGVEYVHIADTTELSPAAKLIYQGVEQTKFGLKINTVDRMKALDNVARHLGMFKDVIDHQSSDRSMTPTTINNFNGDAQAASQVYQDIMGAK